MADPWKIWGEPKAGPYMGSPPHVNHCNIGHHIASRLPEKEDEDDSDDNSVSQFEE